MNKPHHLCYETAGNPLNPCIVLIMGIGGQLIHWPETFIQHLVENGFHVVYFDNRDAGLSTYYDDVPTPDLNKVIEAKLQGKSVEIPYVLDDMARDVIGLMDELNIKKATIAGISMGGIIAQLIAIHYPERVQGLICIATTSGDPMLPPANEEVLNFFFSPQRHAENIESYVDNKLKLYKVYNHPDHVDENKCRKLYIKTYHRAHRPDGFKRQLLAVIEANSRVDKLKKLTVPTLIIHGDIDPVFPFEHGKQLEQCIPGAQLEIIENMGHGLPEALCVKLVNIIVNFIKRGITHAK